ncbi:RNA editing complex protein MP46 [Leishmania mexicana MHOM/GT/2001/U1103]|uniref:RNA editing complex protein MP46 n=1 Tax=Leishmania mexicana (strain MHOM/GT/2001/U1103) TaxID=929439 RepID=E9B435_LEIMU|nr:RNA editing complex protein MP46 [Leishmania mexicana MHOM/GT/2001/U1103]CBZ30003.1 RNA editing complex protein MP46 [Leishmania mexicana MHOM/GT/2001/U1103]
MTTFPESMCAVSCESQLCLLCDTPYISWTEHSREHAHVARSVVCRFFVTPERSESIMQHLERHIALDLKEVDALTDRKVGRRRERLLAGLAHLVEKGVLRDSIPTLLRSTPACEGDDTGRGAGISGATLEVNSDLFLNRVLVGEAFLRREVLDRCARLMPSLTAMELNSVVTYLTSTRQVARIFDELSLMELLVARAESERAPANVNTATAAATAAGRAAESASVEQLSETTAAPLPDSDASTESPPGQQPCSSTPAAASPSPPRWSLSREDKVSIMCACLGELHRFHEQERPRSVISKAAADAIVLNVLAGHGRENLVSELVHETLQRIVDEGTVVWRQHQEDVKRRGRSSEANLTGAARISTRRAPDTDSAVSEDLWYVRTAPLPSKPSPRPASPATLDSAAAEQLVSSYLPFNDVDHLSGAEPDAAKTTAEAPSGSNADGTCTTSPEFISVLHTSEKDWGPLTAELRKRAEDWSRLPFAPSTPELKASKLSR